MYPREGELQDYSHVFALQPSKDSARPRLRTDGLNEVDRTEVMPIVAGMGKDSVALCSSSP
jgi:hypothetical protein